MPLSSSTIDSPGKKSEPSPIERKNSVLDADERYPARRRRGSEPGGLRSSNRDCPTARPPLEHLDGAAEYRLARR